MAIGLENFPNVELPSPGFPNGRTKDNDGSNNGTPNNRMVRDDYHQFFAKLLRASLIDSNGNVESDVNGHQYFEALLTSIETFNWTNLNSAITNPTNVIEETPFKYNMVGNNGTNRLIKFRGVLKQIVAADTQIIQLGSNQRPDQTVIVPIGIGGFNGANPKVGALRIFTNGSVELRHLGVLDNDSLIYLDTIQYWITNDI